MSILFSFVCSAASADTTITLARYIAELQQIQDVLKTGDAKAASSLVLELPGEWRVENGGHVLLVPLGDLRHGLVKYLELKSPGSQSDVSSYVALLLRDAKAMQSAKSDFQGEHARLAEILSRREFGSVTGESWYDRFKRAVQHWLWEKLGRLLLSSAFPTVSRIVIWALVALAVAVAARWIIKSYRQENIYTRFSGSPGEMPMKPWREWHAEAQAAAQEGRWRDAIHLAYWAGIAFLEAQGLWRSDLTRTPREYLRLMPKGDGHYAPLQQLTRSFEHVWYGNDLATAETFASAAALLEQMGCR